MSFYFSHNILQNLLISVRSQMPPTNSGEEKNIGYPMEKQILENSMEAKKKFLLEECG